MQGRKIVCGRNVAPLCNLTGLVGTLLLSTKCQDNESPVIMILQFVRSIGRFRQEADRDRFVVLLEQMKLNHAYGQS